MQFTISGTVRVGGGRKFTRTIEAKSERHARELLYAHFGSCNRIPRNHIAIEKVQKVA